MAQLELPTRAFLLDFFARAMPDLDVSEGSALNDLLIKAMAVGQLPLRHEMDVVAVNQSITNYPYMASTDLDSLAANWGKFRQRGSRSTGTVRMYFDTVTDYVFNYLEFFSTDGTTFLLQAPVRLTVQDLLKNRSGDNLYYADVPVVSSGIGSRYSVPAGSIQGLRNSPVGVSYVENLVDFTATAPQETNADVVNSMFRNLGLRNLVNPQSIRAALYEAFPAITDIKVAGPQASSMVRDLVTVRIGGADVTLHLGAYSDVWVNTNAVQQHAATFSYLPSSQAFKLVSASQASAQAELFSFTQHLLTLAGEWSSLRPSDPSLDESAAVVLENNGIGTAYSLASVGLRKRYHLVSADRLNGTELIPLPSPTGASRYAVDPVGFNMANAGVVAGDIIRTDGQFRRIAQQSGLGVELSPSAADPTDVPSFTFDDQNGAFAAEAGAVVIPFRGVLSTLPSVGDRLVIPNSTAAGHYRLRALTTVTGGYDMLIGNIIAEGLLSSVGDVANHYRWTGTLPPVDLTTCWAELGGNRYRITKAVRTVDHLDLYLDGEPTASGTACAVVQGLYGALTSGQPCFFERDDSAALTSPHLTSFDTTNTLLMSALPATVAAGDTTITHAGLGFQAAAGDVLVFESDTTIVSSVDAPATGGDGSFLTVVVERSLDDDTIEFVPPLAFAIPSGTRFALMRHPQLSTIDLTVTAAAANNAAVTVASVPFGLGDSQGQILSATSVVLQANTVNTALQLTVTAVVPRVATTWLTVTAASLADVKVGDTLLWQSSEYAIRSVDHTNGKIEIAGVVSTGVGTIATVRGLRFYGINASSGGLVRVLKFTAPKTAIPITMSGTGYVNALDSDKGRPVTQVSGGTTYHGVLFDFDNDTRVWRIIPNAVGVDTFTTGVPVTVSYGVGAGTPTSLGGTVTVGYAAPVDPDDIGKYVRQGTYTGILLGVDAGYIWRVKPLSDSDVFDSTDVPTYVDVNSDGEANTARGYGTLRVASTAPVVNTGTTGFTLHRAPNFLTGSTVRVIRRFPVSGIAYGTQTADVYPSTLVNNTVFAGATANHRIVVPFGANVGLNGLSVRSAYSITPAAVAGSNYVSLPSGPGQVNWTVTATVPANTTTLTVDGSGLGLWALPGRALRLVVNSNPYLLPISSPGGNADSVILAVGTPLPLYPGATITVEIVEAFFMPYWVVDIDSVLPYRIFRAPEVPEPIGAASQGSQSGSLFEDSSRGTGLIVGSTFSDGEVLAYIDSGSDASLVPKTVTAVNTSSMFTVDSAFSTTETGVAYHLMRRNRADSREDWIVADVLNASTLALRVPVGWDPSHYGTIKHLTAFVAARDSVVGAPTGWSLTHIPIASITDASLVLDIANTPNDSRHQRPGAFLPVVGFDADLVGKTVWVMLRQTDQVLSRSITGRTSNTYNYYAGAFMSLPLVRILNVQQLDSETLEPVKDLPFTLTVNDTGLRYSADEDLTLMINDAGAVGMPVKVTYVSDSAIGTINSFVNGDDTRVFLSNALVKRMETISVNLAVSVRTTKTAAEVNSALASFINGLASNERLSKDKVIKYLYEQNIVSFIDASSFVMNATYFRYDGIEVPFTNVSEVFGSDTACYLSGIINVSKLES